MTERGEHLVQAGRVPTIGGRTGKHQCQITQNLGQLIEFGNAPHADHGCDGLAAARRSSVVRPHARAARSELGRGGGCPETLNRAAEGLTPLDRRASAVTTS